MSATLAQAQAGSRGEISRGNWELRAVLVGAAKVRLPRRSTGENPEVAGAENAVVLACPGKVQTAA